jgi:hypothetical protein
MTPSADNGWPPWPSAFTLITRKTLSPMKHWFAGGIGENAPSVRARICEGLGHLGIELDEKRNAAKEGVISTAAGRVAVRVIHTDEELMIARSVRRVLGPGAAVEERISHHAMT